MKYKQSKINKAMAIAFVVTLSCATVGVNAASAMSNQSIQNSSSDQHKIVADAIKQIDKAKKKIQKQKATIEQAQDKIAKERAEIDKQRENIAEQKEIIATADGNKKSKIIAKAKKEIVKSRDKIAKARDKIAKHRDVIAQARAEISLQRELIAQARDLIASTKDSDNDGVANNIDLCPDTPFGEEVGADGCALPPESDWSLVWSDEFDGNEIDASKWSHDVDCNGGGNNEQQCYTQSPENSFVEDGKLKIVARSESGQPLPYSSARLVSKNQGDWTFGRFEIRAKAPRGQGSWPAIWMLPTDNVYGGWPHSGEIDIFESVNLGVPLEGGNGVESNVHGTLHYGKSWPNNDSSGLSYLLPSGDNPADDFHIYALEWEEGEVRWYVDDILYQTQLKSEVFIDEDGDANGLVHRGWYTEIDGNVVWNDAPFDARFHMILNFAVGGSWPTAVNQGGIDGSAFNATNPFEIDYVRVYECSISPGNGQGCATVSDNYLDPVGEGGTLITGAAPTPIKPTTGVGTDLVIFDNALNENWPAFVGDPTGSYTIEFDDNDHFEVVEFSFGAAPMVAGFNTTIADSPAPYDGSPLINTGVLEFDLKLVNAPASGTTSWFLKVEQGGQTSAAELPIAAPVLDTWQHYAIPLKTLNTAGLGLNGIDVVMIFPAWAQGDGAVFRVDNVTILEGEAPPPLDPTGNALTDFEAAPASYVWSDFDGGVAEVIANPVPTGINTSAQVGQMLKFAGQPWGGSTLTLDESINIPAATVIGLKVWSQRQVPVLLKLEGMNVERSVTHDGNGWQDLRFDFSGDSGVGVSAITLIFDLGVVGNANADPANWTFYFDDMILPGADGGGNATINVATGIDFEGEQAIWETFENGDPSAPLEFVANPQKIGNTSNTVAKITPLAADPCCGKFAGTVTRAVESFELNSSNAIVKIWVFKDKISPVGIKFEKRHGDGFGSHGELTATNTLVNQWEQLTIDFTAMIGLPENDDITGIAIFPDMVDGRTENTTVYFDNITFSDNGSGSGGESFSTDFEADASTYSFNDFNGGAASIIANPQVNGINSSSQVGQMLKFADQVWGGSTLALDDAINMPVGTAFTMKVWSQRAVPVLFKLEGLLVERSVTHSGTGWEELVFDFGNDAGSVTAITLIFDLGTMGDAANDPLNWTFYFDDIVQSADNGGGPVDPPTDPTQMDLPLDFESDIVNYVLDDFGGTASQLVGNPDGAGTVAMSVKPLGAAPWAGTTMGGAAGFASAIPVTPSNSIMKVWVYSPDAGIPVRLKLEDHNDVTHTVETEAMTTLANAWEELSFNFNNEAPGTEPLIHPDWVFDKASIFFNFGTDGDTAGEKVYYWDDVSFGSN